MRRRVSERWEHIVAGPALVGGVPLCDGPQGALLDSVSVVLDLEFEADEVQGDEDVVRAGVDGVVHELEGGLRDTRDSYARPDHRLGVLGEVADERPEPRG